MKEHCFVKHMIRITRSQTCLGRHVGSGAAWRRSLHQKSAGRERERDRKRREERKRKEREREEKKERKGEIKREKNVLRLYGCKTPPYNCQKIFKDTKRGGGLKKAKKA